MGNSNWFWQYFPAVHRIDYKLGTDLVVDKDGMLTVKGKYEDIVPYIVNRSGIDTVVDIDNGTLTIAQSNSSYISGLVLSPSVDEQGNDTVTLNVSKTN
jgi:hypothetical protein